MADPFLGQQYVYYFVPEPVTLYVAMTIVPRANFPFSTLQQNIPTALVAASLAPTPADGVPPNGQLAPGADVIASQLEAVTMSVAGVYDVQELFIGLAPGPTSSAPLPIPALQVASLLPGNVSVAQGSFP